MEFDMVIPYKAQTDHCVTNRVLLPIFFAGYVESDSYRDFGQCADTRARIQTKQSGASSGICFKVALHDSSFFQACFLH